MPYEKIGDNEPVCIADEVPFEIPDGWEWCRLKNLTNISTGKKDANEGNNDGNFPFFTCSNEHIFSNSYSYDGEYLVMPGNGANIGQVYYYNGKFEAYQRTYLLFNQHNIYLKYLQLHLVYNWKKYNQDKLFGSAIPYIKLNNLENYLVALPPLTEQQRIVTEIEKYLPLINEYDRLQTELDTLDKEFPEKLKKSILQQAIQGKLVEQDSSDEPASILLEKIRKEKEKLIKECKIKKDKNESIIYKRDNSYYEKLNGVEKCIDDEIPFEIPESWEWCRLGSICLIERGGSPRPIKNYITDDKNGINWIKIGDTNKFDKYITKTNEKIIKEGIKHSRFVKKGDFLLTNSMSFGRPYILNIDGCIHDGWLVISNYEIVFDKLYLYWLLSSDYTHNNFCEIVSGAVVKNLNINKVSNSFFPIPPLNEQIRIVKKIEELFSIINKN